MESFKSNHSRIVKPPGFQIDQINRCCSNLVRKDEKSAPMVDNSDFSKPELLSCHEFKPAFVQFRTPAVLEKYADTCMKKTWDLGDDIVPSEQGRKWLIADKKTGRLNGNKKSTKDSDFTVIIQIRIDRP